MIEIKPKIVMVGEFKTQHSGIDADGKPIPYQRKLVFDTPKSYQGLLLGFATEGDTQEGLCTVGIVQKEDGTFETPWINTIKIIS